MALGVGRVVLHFLQLFLSDRLQLLLFVSSFSEAREHTSLGGVLESSCALCGGACVSPRLIPGARSVAVNKSIPECTCSQLRLTEATCCCPLSAVLLETSVLPAVCVVPCFSHFCVVC